MSVVFDRSSLPLADRICISLVNRAAKLSYREAELSSVLGRVPDTAFDFRANTATLKTCLADEVVSDVVNVTSLHNVVQLKAETPKQDGQSEVYFCPCQTA